MKATRFATVVQWGGGHIYFNGFFETETEAQLAANKHAVYLSNAYKKKRGAKPEVMVWEKKSAGPCFVELK